MKAFSSFLMLMITSLAVAQANRDSALLKDHSLPEGVALKDAQGRDNGVRFIDLNADGYDDLVLSNPRTYGVYLFVPKEKEKKNLQWFEGWSQVLREGKAGDANSLPWIVRADGSDAGFDFKDKHLLALLLKVPGPAPRTPEESLKALHLKPGFQATLVAAEPLVQDPVFVDWDAKGRMWVVEMGDYPFAPGEKTTSGESGQGKVSDLQTGRVKILEDIDGDGVMDKATLFLDGLLHPNGLAFWKKGVFIAANPDILYAEDTDGDGKCDRKEAWFSGFTTGNPQHLVNGFALGLDGWFYGANGDSGGNIVCVKSGKKIALGANDFRFHPQTAEFEIDAGRSQYGKWRDDWGNWFGNNNSVLGWHYYLPLHYLSRNPSLAVKSVREVINNDKQVFPVSPPVRRFNWASATNTLTSGCSPLPYRDEAWGDDGDKVLFVCEPANNLVHREMLNYDGITISSSRHPKDQGSEFLASEDTWFRPPMARTGPEGALYVVDMYRQVLEHPEWIPAEIVKGLDIRAGETKGRIYRISKTEANANTTVRAKSKRDEAALLARKDNPSRAPLLRSPNGWVRDTAMRLIIEAKDKSQVPELQRIALDASARSRVQALSTLALLGELKPELLVSALASDQVELRVNAVRLAETASWHEPLAARLASLVSDPSPRVRYQLALSLGAFPKDPRSRIAEALTRQDTGNALISTALKTSMGGTNQSEAISTASALLPVITHSNPDRQKVVQQYANAASLTGDAKRGHLLYTAVCAACHKLKNEGNEIGPDLGTVAGKPLDQLIESILDPNRAVEQRYAVQSVSTKDGKDHVGLIMEENGNNITLRTGTTTELILLKEITQRTNTSKSLMPEGLESVLKPQDVADVMAWIRSDKS